MKINMLALDTSYQSSKEIKSIKSDESFLSVLDNKVKSDSIIETLDEDVEQNQDDLFKLISLLVNNLNNQQQILINKNTDISNVQENIELTNIEKVYYSNELFENNVIAEIVESMELNYKENELINEKLESIVNNQVNDYGSYVRELKLQRNLDKNIIFENISKIFDESISNDIELNEAKFEIESERNFEVINYKNKLISDEENSSKISNFKNNDVYSSDYLNENESELTLLNSIAFSTEGIDKENKDIQPTIIRKQYILQDTIQAIKYLKNNNMEEINVMMSPKELGDIRIKFLKTETENKFIITLSNEDTFSIINENISEIENHLNSIDTKIKQISVEIKSNNQNDFSDNLNQQFNRNNSKKERKNSVKTTENHEEARVETEASNINLLI